MTNGKEGKSQYEKLGIETDKAYIEEIFSPTSENEFPGAWVNITTDAWDPDYVMTMHGDGVGSLTTTRLLCYFATGDVSFLRGDIINAFEMNMDVAAAGFVDKIVAVNVININPNNIPKEKYLNAVNADIAEIGKTYGEYGFTLIEGKRKIIFPMGGETADLPDQTPSCILDASFFSRMPRENVIVGNVQDGDAIFAISSGGQAIWEKEKNFGHMSNGGTHSRISMFHPDYALKFPFLVTEHNPLKGPFRADEYVSELGTTIGKALTSPTRHFGLIIRLIIKKLKELNKLHLLHGIALVSGGGIKKVIKLGKGIRYEIELKDEMILPLFRLIQNVSKESWFNMFKSYNNGIGLQFVGSPESGILEGVIRVVCQSIDVEFYRLGKCCAKDDPTSKNDVVIMDPWGNRHFYDK